MQGTNFAPQKTDSADSLSVALLAISIGMVAPAKLLSFKDRVAAGRNHKDCCVSFTIG